MMQYKGYIGKVEFDDDAKILHGEVVGVRDVVTFQADSVDEVEKAFHDSVDNYLAFCKKRGEQPNKPFSGQFVVRADSDLHRMLSIIAQTSGKSLNTVVVEFLGREVAQALVTMKIGDWTKLPASLPTRGNNKGPPTRGTTKGSGPRGRPTRKRRREAVHA